MRLSKQDIRRVASYFALQYLANQGRALVRISWSWKRSRISIGKGWKFMLRMSRLVRYDVHYARKQGVMLLMLHLRICLLRGKNY